MDDYTDAWFVGFDPDITVGVWVGYDEKVTLGYAEEGARVALPIWIDFMRAHINGREEAPARIAEKRFEPRGRSRAGQPCPNLR